jgi:pyruvate dehydrogenase E1 component
VPNCRAYDPCFAYELAVIVEDGMRRMLGAQEDVFYYVTVMNENYPQPSLPANMRDGILHGMYLVRPSGKGAARVRLLGSGTILREALAAAELLESDFGVGADVYSVTSFTELRREAMALERGRRLGNARGTAWIEQTLPANGTPVVAASDYVSALPDLIRPWIRDRYIVLGTDGFGRSDTRAALRRFFEVDRQAIVEAALASSRREAAIGLDSSSAVGRSEPAPWTR